MFASVNVLIMSTDWNHEQADPRTILRMMAGRMAEHFARVHQAHIENLAARGKPS